MGRLLIILSLFLYIILCSSSTSAQIRQNYYKDICPNVENIVRQAVHLKFNQTFITAQAVIRLFFHDCMVQGCDSSVMVASTPGNVAEKDNPDNLSLAGDGFDTVIKAKAAVDLIPSCRNKVSCADILVMATRDSIALTGGPQYEVELGRLDGLRSKSSDVTGNLPQATFNLDQLNAMFSRHNLTQADMIALSACHTIGFSHCNQFSNRIYNFSRQNPVDPSLNKQYAAQLKTMCPKDVDPTIAVDLDPTTPRKFDNVYFKNLKNGMGLLASDQVLFTDIRSKPTVNTWAKRPLTFNIAFVEAITKLGRVGVKTGKNGNIRFDCAVFNSP